MKNEMKMILAAGLGLALAQLPARSEDKPAFKDDREKASYGLGMYFGNQVKRGGMDVDVDVVTGAFKDVLAGRELKLTDPQAQEAIRNYQQEARRKTGEKNKKEGAAFLASNKEKPGVKTQTVTLQDGTTAEMQYKIITEGSGPIPKSNDMVNVQYRGTLVNGKEFDSTAKRGGQPAKFAVSRVVRGWIEALQMMKTGSKWELYLPSTLGYGDNGFGPNIEPGSTLIFDLELVSVEAPQPAPTPQPLTSDIIRVPSAEELKAGAKPEVIKAEDVEKAKAEAQKEDKKKP